MINDIKPTVKCTAICDFQQCGILTCVNSDKPVQPPFRLARLFICALWSPAGKGLTSWLSFVVSSVSLSLSHWYPGSGVVLDCIDS